MTSLQENLPKNTLEVLNKFKENLLKATQNPKRSVQKKSEHPFPPIQVGNIYKIEANEQNDITPPPGQKKWYKHFVVLGIADDGSIMGCVVFDSEMNRNYIQPGNEMFFIPIPKGKYHFVVHDSYLECMKLKPATLTNIRHGKAEGRLNDDDLSKALELTKLSSRNSHIALKTYNII